MRIATWNVEWFNSVFDREGEIKSGDEPSGRYGVAAGERVAAVTHVLRALDADAIMVIEAPDVNRRRDGGALLQAFAAHAGIRARSVLIGFPNDTRQEIALLHDPDMLDVRHDPQETAEAPRFDRQLTIDLDVDDRPERVRFSKPPLEALCQTPRGVFRMIGVHTKSKGDKAETDAEIRQAIANRRKLLAQCIWVRRRAEVHLRAREPLVVLGDFNDGPGLDAYEALFGRSGVEIVMGEGERRLHDPHALASIAAGPGAGPTSARFRPPGEERWLEVLLDYVFVSPEIAALGPAWRIWHPLHAPCRDDPALARALHLASDHFPVTIDVDL